VVSKAVKYDINEFFAESFHLDLSRKSPILLPITRWGMIKLFRKFGYTTGAEIGVASGRFSGQLYTWIPKLKLYGIDPYVVYDGYSEGGVFKYSKSIENQYELAKLRMAPYDGYTPMKEFSMDAVKKFEDNSLDFVFIDGNHAYEYVTDDITKWAKKVRPGGIIAGHDYWKSAEGFGYKKLDIHLFMKNITPEEEKTVCRVKDAVLDYTKKNGINPWYLTGNDDCSTWLWVKK
jgi:hypothetical protein